MSIEMFMALAAAVSAFVATLDRYRAGAMVLVALIAVGAVLLLAMEHTCLGGAMMQTGGLTCREGEGVSKPKRDHRFDMFAIERNENVGKGDIPPNQTKVETQILGS